MRQFWTDLCKQLETILKLSSVYHSMLDVQLGILKLSVYEILYRF